MEAESYKQEGGNMGELPVIPMEDLFTEIPVPELPLRWISVKNSMDIIGVSERQIRNYIKEGKVDVIHKIVNGRKRVFLSNRSVYAIRDKRNDKYIEEDPEEEQEEENTLLDAFIGLGELIRKL